MNKSNKTSIKLLYSIFKPFVPSLSWAIMTKDEIIKENEELQLRYAKAINTISILERKLEKLQKENKRLRNENRKLKRQNKVLRRAMEIVEQMNNEELDFKRVIQLLKKEKKR